MPTKKKVTKDDSKEQGKEKFQPKTLFNRKHGTTFTVDKEEEYEIQRKKEHVEER